MVVNPRAGGPWDLGPFRMLVESQSAGGQLSGDFYAFRLHEPKRLAVVIGDVCGRGAEGAQLLPSVLPRLVELANSATSPGRLLTELNYRLTGLMSSDRFVTGAAFELDARAGTLTVANAGHVPAMLRRANGEVLVIGRASGPPLGILANCSYRDERHPLRTGDVLVLMTDGIVEAVETDLTAMPKLSALVAEAAAGGGAVHEYLLAQLANCQSQQRADDMTLLSLELLAEAVVTDSADLQQTT